MRIIFIKFWHLRSVCLSLRHMTNNCGTFVTKPAAARKVVRESCSVSFSPVNFLCSNKRNFVFVCIFSVDVFFHTDVFYLWLPIITGILRLYWHYAVAAMDVSYGYESRFRKCSTVSGTGSRYRVKRICVTDEFWTETDKVKEWQTAKVVEVF